MVIVDAQSVKNTDTAGEKGYDAGKKVSGIKRHLFVDTNGLPHSIAVTTANVGDRVGALLLTTQSNNTLTQVEKVLADGGYTGETFARAIKKTIGATVEVIKRNEVAHFVKSYQRGGWSSDHLPGLRSAEGFGRIVNKNSLPVVI
jgi:transposase